jgi:hypothetical protein
MTESGISPIDALLRDLADTGVSLTVRGIRLLLAPADALASGLAASVREHKAALVQWARLNSPCEVCGSGDIIDTPIHQGRSVRRDCARCNRTLGFTVWNPTQP